MLDHSTYKRIYGALIILETSLGLTYYFSSKSKISYAIWIWLNQWCEGGSFTLVPNILKRIYGKHATELYGYLFSFNSTASLILIFVLRTPIKDDYYVLFGIGAVMSITAGLLLFFLMDETPFNVRR